MLNAVIRFALTQRWLTMAFAALLLLAGTWQALRMPIDVFPDLDRPRVVVMTEAPGLAPEEVESQVTFPLESALNGANHVTSVRSASAGGLSVVTVDLEWGTDIYIARQLVTERLQVVQGSLPPGVRPTLAPLSSIMGQVLIVGLWSEGDSVSPLELRTLGDWVIRQRLLTVPGVAQVFTMGGGRKQFQVLVDPDDMVRLGVSLAEVREALIESNENATGGYLDQQGPQELLVRALGRIQSVADLEKVVVAVRDGQPIPLRQLAQVREGAQVKRGDSSAYLREDGQMSGGPAVLLTINKQPGADTRRLTADVEAALQELAPSLPDGVRMAPLYSQSSFIDRAIENVVDALRDGGILVVIILCLFLMNLRTTFISLTAIPLSLAITALVFALTGMSINTMTLGGLAVAIGELVDDAVVDVENIFRRLNENRHLPNPRPALRVVYEASTEIRNSIVYGTAVVILVFLPLFALGGMEGRLFAPLGLAYIVSILASLLVSLTVTPVLSYWLLGSDRPAQREHHDGPLLRVLKVISEKVIRFSLAHPWLNLGVTLLGVAVAGVVLFTLDRDFLPPFNEGAVQLNVLLPPGTSLTTSNAVNRVVEERLTENPDIISILRRTGRAELDEHAEPVSNSEYILELDPHSTSHREEQIETIRLAMAEIPGIVTATEQPISHLISHMISGVKAQIGIKIFGDDLDEIRRIAERLQNEIRGVPGVADLVLEPQVSIPQLRIELDRDKLLLYGLTAGAVNDFIETALNGETVSPILEGQRTFDLVLRLGEHDRENLTTVRRLTIDLPDGGRIPLESVARIYESGGPNAINREQVHRRILLQCNVVGRGVVDVVRDIRLRAAPIRAELPPEYDIQFGGQFEAQQSASRVLGVLFVLSLVGVFLVLYTMFGSANLSLQVMAALPMAFIGSVAALALTGQNLSVASMVGFISLGGIASRNGILLLTHYLHLVQHEGEGFTHEMIVRGGQERLAPVLMTALTSGIGLAPLMWASSEPGKEILYPVATVIVGGLISSTLLDFFVHPALFWLFGRKAAMRMVEHGAEGGLD